MKNKIISNVASGIVCLVGAGISLHFVPEKGILVGFLAGIGQVYLAPVLEKKMFGGD